MRIGYDISQTGPKKAGCGWFAASLLDALVALGEDDLEILLYPTFGDAYWDPAWSKTLRRLPVPNCNLIKTPGSLGEASGFWGQAPETLFELLGRPDLIHSHNFYCPPRIPGVKTIYTFYDLSFLELPDMTSEANRLACFKGVYEAALRADAVMAISRFSRDRFLTCFPHLPEERISVNYPASRFPLRCRPNWVQTHSPANLESGEFWLSVGTLEQRKNHLRLMQAYNEAARQRPIGPLVLAGGEGWLMEDLEDRVNSLGNGQILRLGYVEDDQLEWLYANCRAFLYPSVYEGFGMPVLEALSLGAPVIASGTTSLPEIVADSALMIDPPNRASIREAILQLDSSEELRKDLSRAGKERARQFQWEDSARRLIELYHRTLDHPR